jgi:hypothetical protein
MLCAPKNAVPQVNTGLIHVAFQLKDGWLTTGKTKADAKLFSRFVKNEESNQRRFDESPYIFDFTATGTAFIEEDLVTSADLQRIMEFGGRYVGAGSSRDQGYGRFIVSAFRDELRTEINLAEEISELWCSHVRAEGTIKRTAAELRELRVSLGAKLHQMKKLLSRPGRNGGWASFLMTQNIPLSTADRYVRRHEATLNAISQNVSTGHISCKSEVHDLFQALWPRLRRVLKTQAKLYEFVCLLTTACGNSSREIRDNGVLVFRLLLDNPAIRAFAEGRRAPASEELENGMGTSPYLADPDEPSGGHN